MTPRVKALLDSLAEMDADEVAQVRRGLQDLFGHGNDGLGTREPAVPPLSPLLFGMLARQYPNNN